ncbi:MAG TPA: AmmeMemoRadiSam system radical SAM enzyme [Bacteroidales bacterium]|nr:AmmeMemoRadiSam system radical SAM enzyme [Bacteroidales bacterium]
MNKRDFIKCTFATVTGLAVCPAAFTSMKDGLSEDKHLRLAMFQDETARGIMCNICPNECVLKEGELSDCRNRIVKDNKLHTMAFGNPCAVNIDPVEKKPLYHFHPSSMAFSIATAGCNLACLNCQNWTISQTSPEKTRNIDLMPEYVVSMAKQNECLSIAYTYSEPTTFYEYVYETARLAHESGIKNILVSNGYINEEPLLKLAQYLDAANIDLKSFNDKTYLKLTGGKMQPVLDTLTRLREGNVWLEITNLIVPGWTDNIDEIKGMCSWLYESGFSDTPVHFSRFHPQYKLEQLPPTPVEILNRAHSIATDSGLKYVYIGNVPGTHASDTYCDECGNRVIERGGYSIKNNSIKNNKCSFCGNLISGVW